MRKIVRVALATLVMGLGMAAIGAAHAQQMPAPVIAVIEYQTIMQEASASKTVVEQLTKIRDSFQTQIDTNEKALADENDALEKQRSILSPEAFSQKTAEFEQKVQALQLQVQKINQTIDQARVTANQQIQQAILDIVTELSAERGFNIALPTASTVYASQALFLTSEVLTRLNQRLPRVEVVLPQAQ